MKKSCREPWIDSWRGMLIMLVVFGHLVGTMSHLSSESVALHMNYIFRCIYLFHMPGFFFLSGVIIRANQEGFKCYAKKRSVRILAPYFIWGLASITIFLLTSSVFLPVLPSGVMSYYVGVDKITVGKLLSSLLLGSGSGLRVNSVLWFLPCFFCVELICSSLVRVKMNGIGELMVVGLMFFIGGLLSIMGASGWPMSFEKVPFYVAFMLAGHYSSGYIHRLLSLLQKRVLISYSIIGLVAYLVFVGLVPPFAHVWGIGWMSYCVSIGIAFWGITVSMVLSFSLNTEVLQILGRNTLGIMLIHKFPICILMFILRKCSVKIESLALCFLLLFVGICSVIMLSYIGTLMIRKVAPVTIGEKTYA